MFGLFGCSMFGFWPRNDVRKSSMFNVNVHRTFLNSFRFSIVRCTVSKSENMFEKFELRSCWCLASLMFVILVFDPNQIKWFCKLINQMSRKLKSFQLLSSNLKLLGLWYQSSSNFKINICPSSSFEFGIGEALGQGRTFANFFGGVPILQLLSRISQTYVFALGLEPFPVLVIFHLPRVQYYWHHLIGLHSWIWSKITAAWCRMYY